MAAPISSRTRGVKLDFASLANPKYPKLTAADCRVNRRQSIGDTYWPISRLILRRKSGKDYIYLVSWQDWPPSACSWEPDYFITPDVLGQYLNPPVPQDRVLDGVKDIYFSLRKVLYGKTNQAASFELPIHLDVFRAITKDTSPIPSAVRGYDAYSREDLLKVGLPQHWEHLVNNDGYGRKLFFPILIRQELKWEKENFFLDSKGTIQKILPEPREFIRIRACTVAFKLQQ